MQRAAVLFDLDDTLVVEEASEGESFLAACALARERYGIDPQELHQAVRDHARALWRASPTIDYCRAMGISSWEGLWGRFTGEDPKLMLLREWAPVYRLQAWAGALAQHGARDPAFAEQLAAAYVRERRKRHVLLPQAEETLRCLRSGYGLGIVTNGAPDIQRDKIEASNLPQYFDVIVISGEVGIGKPDSRIFMLAVEKMGANPAMTAMVGDSLHRDVEAAQRAGLKGIWLNRSAADAGQVGPDAQITALAGLPAALQAIGL